METPDTFEAVVAGLPDPGWEETLIAELFPHLCLDTAIGRLAVDLAQIKSQTQEEVAQRWDDDRHQSHAQIAQAATRQRLANKRELTFVSFYDLMQDYLTLYTPYEQAVDRTRRGQLHSLETSWSYSSPLQRNLKKLNKHLSKLYLAESDSHFLELR